MTRADVDFARALLVRSTRPTVALILGVSSMELNEYLELDDPQACSGYAPVTRGERGAGNREDRNPGARGNEAGRATTQERTAGESPAPTSRRRKDRRPIALDELAAVHRAILNGTVTVNGEARRLKIDQGCLRAKFKKYELELPPLTPGRRSQSCRIGQAVRIATRQPKRSLPIDPAIAEQLEAAIARDRAFAIAENARRARVLQCCGGM